MVDNHYRWDFIGLSTDTKPTPETSEKVVDGSTFYCSDNSKLYVYCKDNWYERKALGSGGGGGTSYTAGTGIDITDDTISVDTDTIQEKLTAGSNITISDNVISASGGGTSYTAGTGIDITSDTISVDTDTIQGKLTAGTGIDITSDTISVDTDTIQGKLTAGTNITITDNVISASGGGSVTPVQTTGTSTTDVMSQDATTKLIYPDITNSPYKQVIGEGSIAGTNKGLVINGILNAGINDGSIAIGATDGSQAQIGSNGRADRSVAIGYGAGVARGWESVAIGASAFTNSGQNTGDNVAIGYNSFAGNGTATSTVALGAYAKTTRTGEVNVGTGTNGTGYNNTNYRVIGGVHDGQLANDAVTVAQVNAVIDAINTALSTNIPHIGA